MQQALEQAQEQAEAEASPLDLATGAGHARNSLGLIKSTKAARRGPSIRAMMRLRRGKGAKEGEEDFGGGTNTSSRMGGGSVHERPKSESNKGDLTAASVMTAMITAPRVAGVVGVQGDPQSSSTGKTQGPSNQHGTAAAKGRTPAGGNHRGTSPPPSTSTPKAKSSPGSGERVPTRQEMAAAQVAKRKAALAGGRGLMENAFLAAAAGNSSKLPLQGCGGVPTTSTAPASVHQTSALSNASVNTLGHVERHGGFATSITVEGPSSPPHLEHSEDGDGLVGGEGFGGDSKSRRSSRENAGTHAGHSGPGLRSSRKSSAGGIYDCSGIDAQQRPSLSGDSGLDASGGGSGGIGAARRPASLGKLRDDADTGLRRQRRSSTGASGDSDSPRPDGSRAKRSTPTGQPLQADASASHGEPGGTLSLSLSPRTLMAELSPRAVEKKQKAASAAAAAAAASLAAVGSMQLLQHFKAHTGAVWCAEFSRKGQYLATGGADGLVKVRPAYSG